MGKETYQIKDYVHDELVAFAVVLNVKGELFCNEDEMYSNGRYKLESYNPEDTIPVATFLHNKYSTKLIYFYVSSFTAPHWEAAHQEVFSLFSNQWNEEWSNWGKAFWDCCSALSSHHQACLNKAAAWMLKTMTTKDCYLAYVDDFKNGTLEILI
tara:strand:- start:37 stop:501 length:465 start_codon:yes stop_codon:yes gene_type:complete